MSIKNELGLLSTKDFMPTQLNCAFIISDILEWVKIETKLSINKKEQKIIFHIEAFDIILMNDGRFEVNGELYSFSRRAILDKIRGTYNET